MTYNMKPLSCDPARIKGMSERMIISHYENNYGGAVKRLNLIGEKLAELDYANAPGFLINGLKREELVAMNSMILHEHFFNSLGDQSEPDAALQEALTRDFGSFERWRAEFIGMGKALGGGSGWVLLSWSPRDRKLVNQWAADPCQTLAGGPAVLSLPLGELSQTGWRASQQRNGPEMDRHLENTEQQALLVESESGVAGLQRSLDVRFEHKDAGEQGSRDFRRDRREA